MSAEEQNKIAAGVVVLCGKNPIKADQPVAIAAQTLILVETDLALTEAASALTLFAEKLIVVGSNTIASIAADAENPAPTGAPVTLIVTKEADLKDASLTLIAQGASYKAK